MGTPGKRHTEQDNWPPSTGQEARPEEGLWWPPDDLGQKSLVALAGFLAGAAVVVLLTLLIPWLSRFLPVPASWLARGRIDHFALAVSALVAAAIAVGRFRRSPVFAIPFGLAAAIAVWLMSILIAVGLALNGTVP